MENVTPLTAAQIEARRKNANLETLCVTLSDTIEGLPAEASNKLWKTFAIYQNEGLEVSYQPLEAISNEDLRAIFEALITGLGTGSFR